jgi:hypothetical protein
MYGRYAADSGRGGPAVHGVLRSLPFTVESARLRFILAGPADPGLRVTLREQDTVLASATPSGKPAWVEWNTSEWVGKTVVLVLQDDSSQGALAADEFVAE